LSVIIRSGLFACFGGYFSLKSAEKQEYISLGRKNNILMEKECTFELQSLVEDWV